MSNGLLARWRRIATRCALAGLAVAMAAPASAASFAVYDGVSIGGDTQPDLSPWGFTPIQVIDAGRLWKDGQDRNRLPDRKTVRDLGDFYAAEDVVVLDVNEWSLDGDPASVARSVAKYATLLRWFREAAPDVRFGYFGKVPRHDFDRGLYVPGTTPYIEWQKQNDALRPIAREAGVLFPTAETPTQQVADWLVSTDAAVREARRLGRPGVLVVPILRPRYTCCARLADKEVGTATWRVELRESRRVADGVLVQDSLDRWNPGTAWWRATRDFIGSRPDGTAVTVSVRRLRRARALTVQVTCPAACSLAISATLRVGRASIAASRVRRLTLGSGDETPLRLSLTPAALGALAQSPARSLRLDVRLDTRRLIDRLRGIKTLRLRLRR